MHTFTTSETGAVTVDWVVLTAGLVGLGLATMAVVSPGVQDVSNDTNCQLHSNMIRTSFGANVNDVDFSGGCLGSVTNTGSGEFTYSDGIGSDGEPGFLLFTDEVGPDYATFEAVQSDMSSLWGGSISWDVKAIQGTPNDAHYSTRPLVSIEASDGTTMDFMGNSSHLANANGDWTNVSVDINSSAGWQIDGNPASDAEIQAILADVAETRVQVEQTSATTNEQVGLDGMSFNPAA